MSIGPMPTYRIELAKPATKDLGALPREVQARIIRRINALSANPRPNGVHKIQGEDEQYRIRAGNYRVIYTIQDQVLIVLVLRIGHRREVYRNP